MGRHNLPEEYGSEAVAPHPGVRRRALAIAVVLVLCVTASGAVAYASGMLDFGGSCEDEAVRLDIAASPDVAPALQAAADRARQKQITSDGNCMDIHVKAMESYQVAGALRSGKKTDFQVWVPDSQMWVAGTSKQGGAPELTAAGNIAYSPVTLAMVPGAATDMGWPEKTYSWGQLTNRAMSDKDLRLGAADPSRSATGLLALTKLSATPGKRTEDGRMQAVALIDKLEKRVTSSDGKVMETLATDSGNGAESGRRNDALIVSEQAAFAHNAQSKGNGDDLRLFYPKDGSPQLDYPFTLVDETELSTDESRAALRFMTLLGEQQGREILEDHGYRTNADDPPTALVTAAGGRSPQPYQDANTGQPSPNEIQESLGMWTISVMSARLTTVVDVSGSMAEPVPAHGDSRLNVTKAALVQSLSTFTPQDEIGLWESATHVDGDRDYRRIVPTRSLGAKVGSGTQRDKLTAAFTGLQPTPKSVSALYDSVLAAYTDAAKSYVPGKFNALVVITDGANEDPNSISRSELLRRIKEMNDAKRSVPIIAIAVGPDADRQEAEELGTATGGSGHQVSDPAEIPSVILKSIMEAGLSQPR